MRKLLTMHGVDLVIVTIGMSALMATPAWAGIPGTPPLGLPGPAAGLLAGGAIIGTLLVAKWWRRK